VINAFDRIRTKVNGAVSMNIPQAIARVGLEHFRESFDLQRYNEAGEAPWAQVERRKRGSDWYGFRLGNKKSFSQAAITRNILYGHASSKLRDSIFIKEASARGVEWASSSDHATIHNKGGMFKIFGKKRTAMPKRQFMGMGTRLRGKIKFTVRTELKRVLV